MQNSSSQQQNNEIVHVNLTIGQCRLLQSLIDAEIYDAEAQAPSFKENALKALLDVFFEKTKPTAAENQEALENWLNNLATKGCSHG